MTWFKEIGLWYWQRIEWMVGEQTGWILVILDYSAILYNGYCVYPMPYVYIYYWWHVKHVSASGLWYYIQAQCNPVEDRTLPPPRLQMRTREMLAWMGVIPSHPCLWQLEPPLLPSLPTTPRLVIATEQGTTPIFSSLYSTSIIIPLFLPDSYLLFWSLFPCLPFSLYLFTSHSSFRLR